MYNNQDGEIVGFSCARHVRCIKSKICNIDYKKLKIIN